MRNIKQLLNYKSKHSNYQMLPRGILEMLNIDSYYFKSHYENERLSFIIDSLPLKKYNFVDVGANTGYFTFELLDNGADNAICYEGNEIHADFIKYAAKKLGYNSKVNIKRKFFDFSKDVKNIKTDVMLLLNVLHHIGDDFDSSKVDQKNVLVQISAYLKNLAAVSEFLVFQLGFNWKGDINLPLFSKGTKGEIIDYIKKELRNEFDIVRIGIAEKDNSKIVYRDVNEKNILRDDSLGEFLNRPLFILKAKACNDQGC